MIIIIIQILLLQLFILKPNLRNFSLISFFIFGFIFLIFQFPKIDFRMTRGKNKHLIWHWLDLPIYWIIIGLFYYLFTTFFNKYNDETKFSLKLEYDKEKQLTLNFCPVEIDTYECNIVFYNEKYGEFQYTVEGNVDLPEPERPTKKTNSPFSISRLTLSSAGCSCPG